MDVDAMTIGVQIRKIIVFSIRVCYRSVCNHPFLMGFVCFLIFLYRSSPFVFSLLVSASPVLVCTAVLLGTLLSFGQPNIPEIEKEEKVTTHEIASLKTGVVKDTSVVEKDANESFATLERYVGKRRDIGERRDVVEDDLDEPILVENRGSEFKEDGGLVDCMLLIDVNSREIQFEKQVIEEVGREFIDLELENKREVYEEPRIEWKFNDGAVVNNNSSEDKSPGELIDTCKEDQLDSAPDSSWKRVGEDSGEDDGPNVDESLDSESDGAESSSPDASMADIIPLLDELHPLLDVEVPQPSPTNDGSDSGYGRLHKSDDESVDSVSDSEEDTDNQGEEGEAEDDNDDDDDDDDDEEEEGETAKERKEDESKSAIKWTEDDQKNLMDLGSLELERNQRLESLIARRRARKNMRLMTERNLIDLESSDIPFSIPPIATARRNPFELSDDIYDNLAIPGSAPSVLLPRRNPFDLPYDPNEEKPDLKGDSFQQEFSMSQQKEPVYRRNETFSVGPSIFGGFRQDFKLRPYFMPERFSSEEGTDFPSLQRQLSEVSESKASSVPDTESVNSAVDEEDKKSHEQIPEQFSSEGMDNTTFKRQISEVSESKVTSVPDTESISSAVDEEDKKLNKLNVPQETEVISNTDHGAALVESGSKSSGEDDSMDIEQAENRDFRHDEVEITLGGRENHHEEELVSSETEEISTPKAKDLNANEIHLKTEAVEDSSGSSFSSFSEVDEKIPDMKMEGSTALELKADINDESGVSTQTLPEEFESHFTSRAMEHREPVYDSSPKEIERFFSFVSISSDTQLGISEMIPTLLHGSADRESEVLSDNRQKDSSDLEEVHANPSQVSAVDENESMLKGGTLSESSELDVKAVGSSGVDPNIDDEKGSNLISFSSDIGQLEEYTVYKGERFHFMNNEVVSLTHDSEILGGIHENEDQKVDSVAPTYQNTSADSSLCAREVEVPSVVVQNVLVHPSVSTSVTEHLEDQTKDEVGPMELEQDEVHLTSSSDKNLVGEGMEDNNRHIQHDADEVHSTNFAADIHVDHCQYVGKELHLPSQTGQVPMVQVSSSSSEVDRVLEHSLDKEETRQLEEDQGRFSSQDIDSGFYQDTDAKVVSTNFSYEDAPSGEKSPSLLEKRLSWSDKPSFDDHDESQEAPIVLRESTKEVNITNNANVSKDPDQKEKILENSSYLTSNSTSTPFESPESISPGAEEAGVINSGNLIYDLDHKHKTLKNTSALTSDSTAPFESPEDKSPGGEDVKDAILDKAVYVNCGHVIEHFTSSVEAFDPHVNKENIDEAADDIKEIDEGLLSELDTVGDFSIKDVIGESLRKELTPEDTNAPNTRSTLNHLISTETDLDLPVLEAKSIQDIQLAFRQLHEGADVEEVILPSMLEKQVVASGSSGLGDIISDLPIVEARSMEDIHAVFKQASLSNLAELPKPLESKEQIAEGETKEVVSTEQIESSSDGRAGINENSVAAAYESKHLSEETSETSSPRTPDDKKENNARLRSSSSDSNSENENPERT